MCIRLTFQNKSSVQPVFGDMGSWDHKDNMMDADKDIDNFFDGIHR